jgi:enamine deaminase RidA (YjgF/YER057c/UK114 family)
VQNGTTTAFGVLYLPLIREQHAEGSSDMHQLIRADTIYVSGQASVDRHGTLVGPGDVVAQTRQVLDNMKLALAAAGATLDDVVKVTVYLAHCADRPKVNEVRKAYFGANKPASTLIGIGEFAIPGMLVEIEAIAVRPR